MTHEPIFAKKVGIQLDRFYKEQKKLNMDNQLDSKRQSYYSRAGHQSMQTPQVLSTSSIFNAVHFDSARIKLLPNTPEIEPSQMLV